MNVLTTYQVMPIGSKNLFAFYKKFDFVTIFIKVEHLLYIQNNPRQVEFFFPPWFWVVFVVWKQTCRNFLVIYVTVIECLMYVR